MWILILVLLLLGAQLNLSGIVPLRVGDSPAPWWVGGRLLWPFAVETHTLLHGDVLNTLTPILAITSAILFLPGSGSSSPLAGARTVVLVAHCGGCIALHWVADHMALRLGDSSTH